MFAQPITKEVSIQEMNYMRQQGMTNKQIANNLGCSEPTIGKYLKSERKSPAKLGAAEKQEIAELYSSGSKIDEIADAYGCAKSSIYRILKNLGVNQQRRKRKQTAMDQQPVQKIVEKPAPEQKAPIRLKKSSHDIYSGKFGTYTVDRTDRVITVPHTSEKKMSKEELGEYIRELMDLYREV